MSKRLPYYQSEPAEYLAGDIMFCSFSAQGVFSILRALYWQKDCKLNLTQAKRRILNADKEFEELINEGIIKVDNDNISIYFLDEQFSKATKKSTTNSENGKKGAEARWRKDSESIATPLKKDGESMALREDKIREDKIKEIKEVVLDQDSLYNIDKLQEFYLSNDKVVNAILDNKINNLKNKEHLISRLKEFKVILTQQGRLSEKYSEYTRYFIAWNRKAPLKQKTNKKPHLNITS